MKRRAALLAFFLVSLTLVGSGCTIHELKNTNRRLKEANDRLVAENNRLEQELAASEKDVVDKARRIDSLQGELDRFKTNRVVQADIPKQEDDFSQFNTSEVQVRHTPQGILLRLQDRVFFPQGRATLSSRGKTILGRVAQKLNGQYREKLIRVEGHTDDVPIKKVKKQYPSNWELSTARACTVVRYLVDEAKLNPTRIYPAGFAYYKPVVSARTESARSKNRRVEILILNERA